MVLMRLEAQQVPPVRLEALLGSLCWSGAGAAGLSTLACSMLSPAFIPPRSSDVRGLSAGFAKIEVTPRIHMSADD
eukprot:370229-Rhodomonas_salina.1